MIEWLKRLFATEPKMSTGVLSTNLIKTPSAGQTYVKQASQARRDRLVQALISASERFEKKYGAKYGAPPPEIDRLPAAPLDCAKAAYSAFARSGVMVLRGSVDRYRIEQQPKDKPAQPSTTKLRLSLAARIEPLPNVLRHPSTLREHISSSLIPQSPLRTKTPTAARPPQSPEKGGVKK